MSQTLKDQDGRVSCSFEHITVGRTLVIANERVSLIPGEVVYSPSSCSQLWLHGP
jgi:hypothetical protein